MSDLADKHRSARAVAAGVVAAAALAALLAASPPAAAGSGIAEARWCSVHGTGIAQVQWDCQYPTLAQCADAVGAQSDMCLRNPNWRMRRLMRR